MDHVKLNEMLVPPVINFEPQNLKSYILRFSGKLALIFLSVTLSIFGIESYFKHIFKQNERKQRDHCVTFNSDKFANSRGFSLEHGYYQPLDVVVHCNPEWLYTYHIDELGLRATSNSVTSKKSVLAVGDSFTFGFGVEDNQSFPALLNAYNAGMWGNPFDIQFMSLQRNIELLKPSIVVWSLYPSHVVTMMPNEWSDRCPGSRVYATNNSFISVIGKELTKNYLLPISEKSFFVKAMLKRGNIKKVSVESTGIEVKKDCYATKEILLYDRNLSSNNYTDNAPDNRTFLSDRDAVYSKISGYLTSAYALSKKYNVDFYFVIIPSRMNLKLYDGSFKTTTENRVLDPKLPSMTFEKLIVDAGFEKKHILDLASSFIKAGYWQEYYFEKDAHWNVKGHQFVADILKTELDLP